jgi:hypothetical protein
VQRESSMEHVGAYAAKYVAGVLTAGFQGRVSAPPFADVWVTSELGVSLRYSSVTVARGTACVFVKYRRPS